MSHPRIYISNLSFEATESQLYEFLQDYGVVSVLIPSQTVRGLKNKAVRPFGIAYAEFSNEEDALKVIKELSGKIFMERTLNLRMHIPIDSNKASGGKKGSESPEASSSQENNDAANPEPVPVQAQASTKVKAKRHRLRSFRRKHREENIVVVPPKTTQEVPENEDSETPAGSQDAAPIVGSDPITEAALGVVPPVAEESATSASGSATTAAATGESPSSSSSLGDNSEAAASEERSSANATENDAPVRPASENVAFIGFIPRNTTDDQIRTYFKGLEPQEIIVFKNRTYRRGFTFHRHFTAALVTFPDAEKLDAAKQFVSQEKFKGKQITVKNAFLDKIEEVKQVLVKKTGTNSATENAEQATSNPDAVEPAQNEEPVTTEEAVTTQVPSVEEDVETSTAQAEGETAVEVSKQSETTQAAPDVNVEGEAPSQEPVSETKAPVETDAPTDAPTDADAVPVVGSAGACAQVDAQQPVEQAA